MRVRLLVFVICLMATVGPLLAQPPAQPQRAPTPTPRPAGEQPVTAPTPTPAPVATAIRPPQRAGQAINIKVEFTITDQRGSGPAIKRTLSVVVADNRSGQIRSQSEVVGIGTVPLNIDTQPELLTDGKIRLGFNLQYDWPAPLEPSAAPSRGTVMKTTMHDSVSLILESGKPMIAAQSADPIGDRQVTVEVKATIMK